MTICALTPEQEAIYDSAWNDAVEACVKVADDHAENLPCGQCAGTLDKVKCADTIADEIRKLMIAN